MIQRIQSVYLGLIALISVSLFFLPVVSLVPVSAGADQAIYHLSYMKAEMWLGGAVSVLVWFWPLVLLNILVALLTVWILLQYRKRRLQLRLSQLLFLLLVVLLVVVVYEVDVIGKTAGAGHRTTFSVFAALPVLQLFLCRLAARAIKKDEALVRSADRLR